MFLYTRISTVFTFTSTTVERQLVASRAVTLVATRRVHAHPDAEARPARFVVFTFVYVHARSARQEVA
jgi:hypothetical protein